MKEILKEHLESGVVQLPDSAGIVAFFGDGKMLMCAMTSDISAYLAVYFGNDIDDKNIGELLEQCDKIGYWETSRIFEALLGYKALEQKYNPHFNRIIRYYDDYQYLGLNFVKVPFIKVESTTVNDFFYIGPFRSRYFVHDVIDASENYYKTPCCPGETFPCELLEAGKCAGYCTQNHDMLAEDLTKYFLQPKQENLDIITKEIDTLLDGFLFTKAEVVKHQKKLLSNFYHQVAFLTITKHLNIKYEYDGKQIEIAGGLLKRIDGRILNRVNQKYQPNELFAVDKSELDERWVIYNEVSSKIPEKLLEYYDATRQQLVEYLLNKE